jgi:endonuclease/exonuclease/phosphatase family metal-dependent hydrolase
MTTPHLVTETVPDLSDPVVIDTSDHLAAATATGVLDVVEVGGRATAEPGDELRVVAANLERGRNLEAWADLLASTGGDVFLLSELDGGMARSENRYVARELAERLGAEFAFAVEFVELGLGSEKEAARLPAGASNEFGVHGGAILSRVGLGRPAAVRFEFDGSWFGPESPEPRIGGRLAVVAEVGGIAVVAPHLESHGSPAGRAQQIADLDDVVSAYASGRPVIIGGDLNTHTLDHIGHGLPPVEELTPERFRDPIPHEPLFAEAAARGYEWEEANTTEPTHRTRDGRGDVHFDWFLTRDLQVRDPEVIPAVDPDGNPLSDHEVIAVTISRQ